MQLFKPEYINLLIAGASYRASFDRISVEHDYRLGGLAFGIATALTVSAVFIARIREKARLDELRSEKVFSTAPGSTGSEAWSTYPETSQAFKAGETWREPTGPTAWADQSPGATRQRQETWPSRGLESEGKGQGAWTGQRPAEDLDTE